MPNDYVPGVDQTPDDALDAVIARIDAQRARAREITEQVAASRPDHTLVRDPATVPDGRGDRNNDAADDAPDG